MTKKMMKKKKKQEPFRFLDLTAELRNEIYELALVEPNGLTLLSRTKSSRRSVTRGAISIIENQYYYGKSRRCRWYSGSATSTEAHHDRMLVPNLLAVNQQIREEASSYLYKQDIILEDTTALLQFIATIGPYNRQLVNHIVVRGWGGGKFLAAYTTRTRVDLADTLEGGGVTRGHNFSALTMLASCTNLDSLYFDCTIGHHWESKPLQKLAGQIYRDAHHFLEAYARVNGLDSALKVIQFGDRQFAKDPKAKDLEFDQSKRDIFEKELERLMKKGSHV